MRRLILPFAFTIFLIGRCAPVVDFRGEVRNIQTVLGIVNQAVEDKDIDLFRKAFARDQDLRIIGPTQAIEVFGWSAFEESLQKLFHNYDDVVATSKNQNIEIHKSGRVAWFSHETVFDRLEDDRIVSSMEYQCTGVLEKRMGRWIIVQLHVSSPNP